MALIECPECKAEISDKSSACIKCGCPISAQQAESPEQPAPATQKAPPVTPSSVQGNVAAPTNQAGNWVENLPGWVKWGAGGFIGLIILGAILPNNTLKMVDLSSDSPLFGTPTVTATMVNDGDSMSVNYWIRKGSSDAKHCQGSTFFAANERRTLRFRCAALTGYSGRFTMGWAPK